MSQSEKINTIENILVRLIKCERYFELTTGHDGEFWSVVQNAVGEVVCLFWCHIFGNRKDDLHFSQFFNESSENAFEPAAVKKRMLVAMDITEAEYEQFWKEVKACRDKFVSHKEYGASVVFPHINLCRVQAEEFRRILSDYAKTRSREDPGAGWKFWVDYYENQWLGERQFKVECEKEFSAGVSNVA